MSSSQPAGRDPGKIAPRHRDAQYYCSNCDNDDTNVRHALARRGGAALQHERGAREVRVPRDALRHRRRAGLPRARLRARLGHRRRVRPLPPSSSPGGRAELRRRKRYSPACTKLLSQYKTMLKLVGDDVPSVEEFMARYKVRCPACPCYVTADWSRADGSSRCAA